jgi:hypothetical protein
VAGLVRSAAALLLLMVGCTQALAADPAAPRNLTAGGPLRHGVYGRIEVRDMPPAVIYSHPVVASSVMVPPHMQPVYLYVPPGQVRKWKQHCGRWNACDEAVLFVRMEQSPSLWGRWRQRRDQVAQRDD